MSIDFDSSRKVVRAGYKPVVDETALTRPAEGPVQETPEKAPEQEINLKLYCSPDELNTLQTGVWLLGATDNEKAVAQWKKQQTSEGDSLLTAQCFEAEEKTLYHDLFLHSGQSDAYTVMPNPVDSQVINAEFIPVKLAVQVSDTRLGWPTAGYFYLFCEGKLTKEFKVAGDGRWTFQVTRSDASNLTEELLSEHHYASILLPYKIEGQPAPGQHLLYREEKLTADELAEASLDWLNQHAMTLDMDQVVGIKQTPLLERSAETTPENEVPSPIETLAAVHPYGDTWGRYNQHEIDAQTVNITQSPSIADHVPVLNVAASMATGFSLGWIQVLRSQSQAQLWADLFTEETSEAHQALIQKYNTHLNEPVRQGELVLLPTTEPENDEQRQQLNAMLEEAQAASSALCELDDGQVAAVNRHFELLDHYANQRTESGDVPSEQPDYYAHASTGVGIATAMVEQHLKNINQVLLEINDLYVGQVAMASRVGGINYGSFVSERAALFKKLDDSFAMLSKRSIQLPVNTQIKRALRLSTKSVVHHADEIIAKGFVPNMGKRIANVARGIAGARWAGYVGVVLGGASAADSIYEACKVDGSG
ncbi:hypothetical protein, partial [Vibrio sp. V39_P1S14PM300]|uniref:hypothetical protein n=1 Tax=Vibrio sp. V39_P1S14PM300 TaxID=1938690 RepID=UPI00137249BB